MTPKQLILSNLHKWEINNGKIQKGLNTPIARDIGISRMTLHTIMTGGKVSRETIEKVAKWAQVDPKEIES